MGSFSLPSQNSQASKTTHGRDGEKSPITQNKYKEIISTLPTDDGWKYPRPYYLYQGFWYLPSLLEVVMEIQENFKAQPTDIVVCSYPKTGTTWLKALTYGIVTRKRFDDSANPLLTTVPHDCVPFLEVNLARNYNNRNLDIPLVATHIPFVSLPKSIMDSGSKMVYICRDPKDVFVSDWHFKGHFLDKLEPNGSKHISLEEGFNLFCKGVSLYGSYWDHVLGYWRASLEWPDRVLFLKYEDMRNETPFYVKRLAEFLGHSFSLEEEQKGMVQKVIEMCSFENLSGLEVNKSGKYGPLNIGNNAFFRKGKVGDWENHLTREMATRLEQIMEQKLSGSGLTFMPHQMQK